jgi:hypothetical protein
MYRYFSLGGINAGHSHPTTGSRLLTDPVLFIKRFLPWLSFTGRPLIWPSDKEWSGSCGNHLEIAFESEKPAFLFLTSHKEYLPPG